MKRFELEFKRNSEENIIIQFMAESKPTDEEILKIAENGDFGFDPKYESYSIDQIPLDTHHIDYYLKKSW
jgi:hypothetical protein